jgi:hypothetical protein
LFGDDSPALRIFEPIPEMKLQIIPGNDTLTPEIDLSLGTDEGEMEESVL